MFWSLNDLFNPSNNWFHPFADEAREKEDEEEDRQDLEDSKKDLKDSKDSEETADKRHAPVSRAEALLLWCFVQQGFLADKKQRTPRILQKAYAWGPIALLGGGGGFL